MIHVNGDAIALGEWVPALQTPRKIRLGGWGLRDRPSKERLFSKTLRFCCGAARGDPDALVPCSTETQVGSDIPGP